MPPNTKSVTRPGPFGNPFRPTITTGSLAPASTADCVEVFRQWLQQDTIGKSVAIRARQELRGFNLACYCPLGSPCHADVLLELANNPHAI